MAAGWLASGRGEDERHQVVHVGGELVDWETFLELPPSVRQETLNHLEETTGPGGVNLDGHGIRDAVKTAQLATYQGLG